MREADRNLEEEIAAAEARGEAQANLTAQVASHERRLKEINGSIGRNANETRELRRSVEDIASRMATQEKLEEWKREQERKLEDERKERDQNTRSWKQVLFAALAGGAFVLVAAGMSVLAVVIFG